MSELETASSLNTFINYLLEEGISIEYAEINKWKKYTMESPNFPKEYVFRRKKNGWQTQWTELAKKVIEKTTRQRMALR